MSDVVEVVIRAKDETKAGISSVKSGLSGLGSAFAPIKAVGTAAFLGVGAAAIGGFGLAMGAAIDMNASLEQSTMQFTTLMGDADQAAEHVANLFEFGAKTPFETGPIITASKHLQIFGGDALNTMENLTLVGDAAAAVGAPIDEVGFWVGRAYSAIQGGQPFGEAAMRLQELGLMTPEVLAEMEELQKSGADVSDVWGVMTDSMGSFAGAMEMQSQSWTGLMSTLKDQLATTAATALKPFFDLLKGGLDWLVNSGVLERVGALFSNLTAWIVDLVATRDPISGYWEMLPAKIQPIAEVIGRVVIAFLEFFDGIRSGEDIVGDFANLFWRLAGLFGATEEQATGVFNAVRALGDKIIEFIAPVAAWVQNNVQLKDVLAALGVVIASVVLPALIGIISAVASVALPFIALVGVITLLRTAWENNWGGIQEKTAAVIGFLRGLVGQLAAAFIEFFQGLASGEDPVGDFANLFWRLADLFGATEEQAKGVFEAVRMVGDVIMEAAGHLRTFIVEQVLPFVQEHGPQIKQILGGIVIAFGAFTIISTVVGWITGLIGAVSALGAAITAAGGIVSFIVAILGGPLTIVIGIVAAAVALFAMAWKNNWGGIQEKTAAVVDFLRGLIEGFLSAIRAFWDEHGAAIVATAQKAWELIQGLIDGVVKQIQLIVAAFRAAFEGDWHRFGEIIYELWENAWNTVINFIRGLWDLIRPILVNLWNSIRDWFTNIDWGSLGRRIIDGIIHGIQSGFSAVASAVQGIIDAAIGNKSVTYKNGIQSARALGAALGQALIAGIEAKELDLVKTLEALIGGATSFGNLAGGFESIFEAQSIAPLEGALADVGSQIGGYNEVLQSMAESLGLNLADPSTLLALQQMAAGGLGASAAEQQTALSMLEMLRGRQVLLLEQVALQEQLVEQQNRLLRLETQRQQLNFLQQQFDLIKLINENGLDPNLLNGLTFGANADPGAFMDAMVAAMEQLINQTAGSLAGFGGGVRSRSSGLASEFFAGAAGQAEGRGAVVINIDARGAANGVEQDVRKVVQDVMREYGLRADIRSRTS